MVSDSIWPGVRDRLMAEGFSTTDTEGVYETIYLTVKLGILNEKGINTLQYSLEFSDPASVEIIYKRVTASYNIHKRQTVSGIGTEAVDYASSFATPSYVEDVRSFYRDLVLTKPDRQLELSHYTPGSDFYNEFMKAVEVTNRDPLYDNFIKQTGFRKSYAEKMLTDFHNLEPALYPASGSPEFNAEVARLTAHDRQALLTEMPDPLSDYVNQLKDFYVDYYKKHSDRVPPRELFDSEGKISWQSDYVMLIRFLNRDKGGTFLGHGFEDFNQQAQKDYDLLESRIADFKDAQMVDSDFNIYEAALYWYSRMKRYNTNRHLKPSTPGFLSAFHEHYDTVKKWLDYAGSSFSSHHIMSQSELDSFNGDRVADIAKIYHDLMLKAKGAVLSDGISASDVRNWYRQKGLSDDGTPLTTTDEIKALWDKAKTVVLAERDEAIKKLSNRFSAVGKYTRFASFDINDVEWQLYTRSSAYRNLKLHVSYNEKLRRARKGMLSLSNHSSFILETMIAFMAYEYNSLQNASFALYIDSLSENRAQMDKDIIKVREINALFLNSSLFFLPWLKGALLEYHDAVELSLQAYESISHNFNLAQEGVYRFQAVIDEKNDNVTLLSVLPDKNDRMEFPTWHIPEKAQVGSIISFQIAKYDSPDIKDWTRITDKVINVHDGDTFTLTNGIKIRILPINAPELKNPDGTANPEGIISANILTNLILNQMVDCYADPTNPEDSFGRTLAYVYRNGVNIGQWMMDNGYAKFYMLTNAWFSNLCIGVDSKYTYLEPLDELSDLSPGKHFIIIRIPNYFMPFAADFSDIVFIRAMMSDKVTYRTTVVCVLDIPPGYGELRIEPDKIEFIKVDLPFLKKYVSSPCGKRIRISIRKYYPCEEKVTDTEIKTLYDHIDGADSIFTVTGTAYTIVVPTDRVPPNVGIDDDTVFAFDQILPYIIVTAQITDIIPPNVWLVHGTTPPVTFYLDQSLIPFPVAVGDKIGIELGKNIGDYFVADFHARLGNNINQVANFIKLPEETISINIPLKLVETIVQDPNLKLDTEKIQINETAFFKIMDRSFTNSFKASLDRIDGANGIWKILPDEKTEITIPSIVAGEFLTMQRYSEYPTMTFSIRQLKALLTYDAMQQIEIVSTDCNNTTLKFLHIKFGLVQAVLPTRLFSWETRAGDQGIFNMTLYSGLDSEKMYVDSISESEAKIISMTKKDVSMHYPVDKLPKYLKRFDTVRLQVRTQGWTKIPSGLVAQDIVDKYKKITTTKYGIVKRKVPARVPDPLDMFVIVRSLDDGYGNAITQRTDNQAWIDIPVLILPLDTDVGDTLCLNVNLNFYRETYFTARFMSLTLPDTCSFLVEQSMNFPFSVPLSWIPASSFINGSIGFKLTKKVTGDNFEATHKITTITAADVTLKGISDGKTVVFDRALLPYVRLPTPDDDIINLQVGMEFRLVTQKKQ